MRIAPFLLMFFVTLAAVGKLRAEEDDMTVAARQSVLELAGAFSANDGYKLRDGHFNAALKPGESRIVAVNLYSGNSYWFCAASSSPASKLDVIVFDEDGKPVPLQTYASPGRAAAGYTPSTSGLFYVRIALPSGDPGAVCLLYTYK